MASNQHIIKRQVVDVQTDFEENIYQFQEEIAFWIKHHIPIILNRVFERHNIPNITIQFDELILDLGDIDKKYFKIEFQERLAQRLNRVLTEKIGELQLPSKVTKQKGRLIPNQDRQIEVLQFFLEKGFLPWSSPNEHFFSSMVILEDLLDKNPNLLINLLRKLKHQPQVIKRLSWQLSTFQFQQLLQLLSPSAYLSINNIIQSYLLAYSKKAKRQLFHIIKVFSLSYFLKDNIHFQRHLFIKELEDYIESFSTQFSFKKQPFSKKTQEESPTIYYPEIIQFYLKFGVLPPHVANWDLNLLENYFLEQLQYHPSHFRKLFVGLSPEIPFVKRLVLQFKASTIQKLIAVLAGKQYEVLAPLIRQLTQRRLSIDTLSLEFKYQHLPYEGLIHYLIFEDQDISSAAFTKHFFIYLQKFTILSHKTIQILSEQVEVTLLKDSEVNHTDFFEQWLRYASIPTYNYRNIVDLFEYLILSDFEALTALLKKYSKKQVVFIRLIQQLPEKVIYNYFGQFAQQIGILLTPYITHIIKSLRHFPQANFQVYLAFFKAITQVEGLSLPELKKQISSELIRSYAITDNNFSQKVFQEQPSSETNILKSFNALERIKHFLNYGIWLEIDDLTFIETWRIVIEKEPINLKRLLYDLMAELTSYRLSFQLEIADLEALLTLFNPNFVQFISRFLEINWNKPLFDNKNKTRFLRQCYQFIFENILLDKKNTTNETTLQLLFEKYLNQLNQTEELLQQFIHFKQESDTQKHLLLIEQFLQSGTLPNVFSSHKELIASILALIKTTPASFFQYD